MEIKEYITPILKWWWLVVIATVVAAAASFLASRQQPQYYRSTATLAVGSPIDDPNPTSGDLYLTGQLAKFYVDMAYRPSVYEDTMEALGLNWLPEFYVRNVDNLIDIIVTDTNPQRAQAVAFELTNQLILRSPTSQQRNLERQEFINRQLDSYETAITDAQAEIAAKQERLTSLTSAREIADLQDEIARLEESMGKLEASYTSLLAGTQQGATNSIRIVEPATLPTKPIQDSNTMTILLSAVAGLALAVGAAYLLEYLDNTVSTPERLAKASGWTTLAGIAEIKENSSKLITVNGAQSPIAEAYRVLRTAVLFADTHDQSSLKTLSVISAIPGEGKSTTAANLSVVLAQAGYNVLLIDGDLRRPTQHRIFELSNKRGVTSLLLQMDVDESEESIREMVEETLQPTYSNRLNILTCGPIPPNPSEMLGSNKMRRLLNAVEQAYDYVLLDGPPLLSVADGMILSRQADGVIYVAGATTKKEEVKEAALRLREINANVIGSVLNGLKSRSEGYKALYYYRDPYSYKADVGKDDENGDPAGLENVRERVLPGQIV